MAIYLKNAITTFNFFKYNYLLNAISLYIQYLYIWGFRSEPESNLRNHTFIQVFPSLSFNAFKLNQKRTWLSKNLVLYLNFFDFQTPADIPDILQLFLLSQCFNLLSISFMVAYLIHSYNSIVKSTQYYIWLYCPRSFRKGLWCGSALNFLIIYYKKKWSSHSLALFSKQPCRPHNMFFVLECDENNRYLKSFSCSLYVLHWRSFLWSIKDSDRSLMTNKLRSRRKGIEIQLSCCPQFSALFDVAVLYHHLPSIIQHKKK